MTSIPPPPPPPLVACTFHSIPSELLRGLHDNRIIRLVQPGKANTPGSELKEWLQSNAKGASALIVWVLQGYIGKEYLDIAGTDTLKVVSSFSVGYDHIDVDAFKSKNVRIGTTPNVSDNAVADTTLLLLLMLQRRAMENVMEPKAGRWMDCVIGTGSDPTFMNGSTVRGKTVAFYGFGRIAQKVAERILPLGPSRILYKTSQQSSPFTASAYPTLHLLQSHCYANCSIENRSTIEELVQEADVVICLTALTPNTKGTINQQTLASFKKGAFLINVGRGPVVDNDALIEALHSERLAGVALDVLDGEPFIKADHPLLSPDLVSKVVLFPHHGSAEIDARKAMAELVARNVFHGLGLTKDSLKMIQDDKERQRLEELIDGPTNFI